MLKFIKSYMSDESGASAAEYALILAIIGTALFAAVGVLGNDIASALNKAGGVVAGYNY